MNRIHNYVPKQSFLQLQRTQILKENESDPFLLALEKIKKEQEDKREE